MFGLRPGKEPLPRGGGAAGGDGGADGSTALPAVAVDTTLCVEWKEVKALSPLSAARPLPRLARQASFDSQDFLQVPLSPALPAGVPVCRYTVVGHPSWPWPGARWALLPAAPLPARHCQLAAGSGAALTSAVSRAVSWEKSVHGASLPWQCNLLRASKSRIASPVATGSGPGVARTGNGDTQRDVLAWRVLPGSRHWGARPWRPCTRACVCVCACAQAGEDTQDTN